MILVYFSILRWHLNLKKPFVTQKISWKIIPNYKWLKFFNVKYQSFIKLEMEIPKLKNGKIYFYDKIIHKSDFRRWSSLNKVTITFCLSLI